MESFPAKRPHRYAIPHSFNYPHNTESCFLFRNSSTIRNPQVSVTSKKKEEKRQRRKNKVQRETYLKTLALKNIPFVLSITC